MTIITIINFRGLKALGIVLPACQSLALAGRQVYMSEQEYNLLLGSVYSLAFIPSTSSGCSASEYKLLTSGS